MDASPGKRLIHLGASRCYFAVFKENAMNRSIRSLSAVLFLLLALLLLNGAKLSAQTFRGTILGTVIDSSGGAVTGATVTIKNTDIGLIRTVTTSDDGTYAAPELPIGNYSVTVEKP